MSNRKPDSDGDAFFHLLEGDNNDSLRDVADDVRAERDATRDNVRRAASHARQGGEHAARWTHEKAQAIGASVRQRAPVVAGYMRQKLAVPIRWRVIIPIMLCAAILAIAFLLTPLLLSSWHASKGDEQIAALQSPEKGTPVVSAPASVVVGPPASPTPEATGGTNDLAPPVPAAPPVLAESSTPQASPVPESPALPPTPANATVESCSVAVPLLNGLLGSATRAKTKDEIAWAAFGYLCAQSGALAYSNDGYAVKAEDKKEAEAGKSKPTPASGAAATPATLPSKSVKPSVKPRATVATTVPAPRTPAPAQPVPVPATCVLRGTVMTVDHTAIADAPVEISWDEGAKIKQRVKTDTSGRFSVVDVPSAARVRVMLRARGYRDDVRESVNCGPVALVAEKSNPLSSLFDAARRVDRSIQKATTGRP